MKSRAPILAACLALLLQAHSLSARCGSQPPVQTPPPATCRPLLSTADLAGHWTGHITQNPSPFDTIYQFALDITTTGDRIQGSTYIAFSTRPEIWGIIAVEGRIHQDHIRIEERHVTQEQMLAHAYWCLKSLHLQVAEFAGRLILSGTWTSDDCSGSTGRIYLERSMA